MHCPFPGMDPYIEDPGRWRGFHTRMITGIAGALQKVVRPKYVAECEERLFVVEPGRDFYPDVTVVKSKKGRRRRDHTSTAATLERARPSVFPRERQEIRQPYVTIVHVGSGKRVVTAIELLSPDNKRPGEGQDSYVHKRDEYVDGGANVVEIDLLRAGDKTVQVPVAYVDTLPPWHYLVSVTRQKPDVYEVYGIALSEALPVINIPLAGDDPDVTLDLQAVFTQCWDDGPYPELLAYDGLPPGPLSPEDVRWCGRMLRASGYRRARRS